MIAGLRRDRLRVSNEYLAILLALESLVIAQAVLAYNDQFLTVAQMRQRGVQSGLPFVWHFAMWSDLAIVSPLAAYIIVRFRPTWTFRTASISAAIGAVVSVLLHWFYALSDFPEGHTHDHQLTGAGIVHLVYMAVALAVFTQFYLFTNGIPRKLLAAVSIILFAHVLVGTHMLLGLLTTVWPMEWYGSRPLRSLAGWMTIATVGIALLSRNLHRIAYPVDWERLAAPEQRFPILRRFADVFEFWTLNRFDTTERFLKSLDYIASYVGFSAFLALFVAKLQISTAFSGGIFRLENWITFISDTALPCLLILLFGIIHALGRQSIRMELSLGPKLFPPGRVPLDWGGPKDRVIIFVTVIGFLLLFLLLTWFADNILVASSIMFVLACNDWRTRYLIEDGIRGYFANKDFAPVPEDKDYRLILERRKVADEFLFVKPHLWKEGARIVGCGLALAAAVAGYIHQSSEMNLAAYAILIVTLVLNEIVTMRWRYGMFHKMRAIEKASADAKSAQRSQ